MTRLTETPPRHQRASLAIDWDGHGRGALQRTKQYAPSGRGFTLIEVLATILLSSLLLAALVGTVGRLKEHTQAVSPADAPESWRTQLAATIRRDVQCARLMQARDQQLVLWGYAGHDANGRSTWRPSEIVYQIDSAGGRDWLLRWERPLVVRSNEPAKRDVMCAGFAKLGVVAVDQDAALTASMPSQASPTPVPSQLKLQFFDASNAVDFEVIVLRARP